MSDASLLEQLTAIVGADHVLTGEADMAQHLVDWRGRYRGAARCVVRPANTGEVSALVRACAQAGVAMVAQSNQLPQQVLSLLR